MWPNNRLFDNPGAAPGGKAPAVSSRIAGVILFIALPVLAQTTSPGLFGDPGSPPSAPLVTRPYAVSPLQETDAAVAAERWGVAQEDWGRYVELMQGEAGMYYSHMEPAAVLGIYARDDAERQRFAELWTQREHDRVTKLLDFNRAFHTANQKLYADAEVFDRDLLESMVRKISKAQQGIVPGERVALFISLDCAECDRLTDKLVQRQTPMDIYVLGAKTDTAIQQWAMQRSIPLEQVKSKQITLNHDNGTLKWVSSSADSVTPQVYSQHEDGWALVELAKL